MININVYDLNESQIRVDHLRFYYKNVSEYNSAIFGITSMMMLCEIGDYVMVEKTISTFHHGNVVLQQQYLTNGYTRYLKLIQVLIAEKNN